MAAFQYPSVEDMNAHQLILSRLSSVEENGERSVSGESLPCADDQPLCPSSTDDCAAFKSLSLNVGPICQSPSLTTSLVGNFTHVDGQSDLVHVTLEAPVSRLNRSFLQSICCNTIRQVVCRKDANDCFGIVLRQLDGAYFVQLVVAHSSADEASLRFGDQILQINGVTVTGKRMKAVKEMLRSNTKDQFVMTIRNRPFARTVILHRDRSACAFGFRHSNGRVRSVAIGTSAEMNGLMVDQQIIEVNGRSVVGMSCKSLTCLIDSCSQTIVLTLMPGVIFDRIIRNRASMGCDKVCRNLALLLEKLSQDPESYREEFLTQLDHFKSTLRLMELQADAKQEGIVEMVFFLANACPYYASVAVDFAQELTALLKRSGHTLVPVVRLTLCKALLILNTRGVVDIVDLLELFVGQLKCRDKALRLFLFTATVGRIKKMNSRRRDQKLNSNLQSMLLWHTEESSAVVARFSALVLIELYRRNFWRCAKVSNGIAQLCLSPVTKISVTATRFLLGSSVTYNKRNSNDDEEDEDGLSDDEDESNAHEKDKSLKEILMAYRVAKKSKKRSRVLEKAKQAINKKREQKLKKKSALAGDTSAVELLYDPQEFVEKLFQKLRASTDRFEVRLLYMALISRVIMVHRVLLLSFYPFIQRYLAPHQRYVTKILLFAAHATHDLVPPDVVQEVVGVIANNFITDRNSSEAITVGLNAVREVVTKCPLAITTELMQDLAAYKKYKNKNVSVGAKGLIHLFRRINPKAISKKDRGRPTMAMAQQGTIAKPYGHVQVDSYIRGAEVLTNILEEPEEEEEEEEEEQVADTDESETDDGSWIDVTDDEEMEEEDTEENEETAETVPQSSTTVEQLCTTKILTQKDFDKISAALTANQVTTLSRKRKSVWENASSSHEGRITRLRDIEHLSKRPKQDKASRVEAVKDGRDPDRKFGRPKCRGPHVGRNKRQLGKRKAFAMVKHKLAKKSKNRSFREQQQSLRRYLMGQGKLR